MRMIDAVMERATAFGFSAQELAERARVPLTRLDPSPGAAGMFTVDELLRLGRTLLFDVAAVLHGEPFDDPLRSPARFRAVGPTELSARDVWALARAGELSRQAGWLARLLAQPRQVIARRELRPVAPRPEAWEQGYDLGERARRLLFSRDEPIPSMLALFDEIGLQVVTHEFESKDVIAASVVEPDGVPVVVVNCKHRRGAAATTLRTALAHELCHVLHDGGEHELTSLTCERGVGVIVASEQRANGFAPAFVVTRDQLRRDPRLRFDAARTVEELKASLRQAAERWGLGTEAIVWHAKNAKLLNDEEAERFVREGIGNIAPTFHEPLPAPGRWAPASFTRLVDLAASRGDLSEAKARQLLE